MRLHLRHKRTDKLVRVRRIKHYALTEQEVALLQVLLKSWRAIPQPLESDLLEVTDSLEEKLR